MNTNRVAISADSTCDLSAPLAAQYGITTIPLYITKNGVSLTDGIQITPDEIFAHVSAGGDICTTAAVNVADYLTLFARLRREHDSVVHFTISSEMSSCFVNARLAAAEVGGVYVVDSRTLSTGIGHLVLDAAQLAADGVSGEEIYNILEQRKAQLNVSFILDTLAYLHKGGRCSAVAALGANLLHLKPCIEVREGVMGVGKKYHGKLESALVQYVQDKLAQPETVDSRRLFITDSGVPEEIYQLVRETALRCVPFAEVHHTRAGCTVSSHCGPRCLGILFYNRA